MEKQKIIFEKVTAKGKYQAIKEESDNYKKIVMRFLKKNKSKTIWEIKLLNDKINIVAPFLGIKWPSFSAERSKTFIEIPKQLNEIKRLSYPQFMRKFLTDSSSNTTLAWLNLNGHKKNLSYFGQPGPGYYGGVVHKELLKILSEELGIKLRQI